MNKIKKLKAELLDDVEESVYSENKREELVDDDELTPLEEAFMAGWDQAEKEEIKEVE